MSNPSSNPTILPAVKRALALYLGAGILIACYIGLQPRLPSHTPQLELIGILIIVGLFGGTAILGINLVRTEPTTDQEDRRR